MDLSRIYLAVHRKIQVKFYIHTTFHQLNALTVTVAATVSAKIIIKKKHLFTILNLQGV